MKKINLFIILFFCTALVGMPVLAQDFKEKPPASLARLQIIDPPRPFPNLIFEREYGARTVLSHHEGQLVFLNFWATWCPPCIDELPSINTLAEKMDDHQFRVIAVSGDHQFKINDVVKFLSDNNWTHLKPYLDSDNDFQRVPEARGLPTTVVINPDGFEIARFEGDADWASPEALEYFQRMKEFYFPKKGKD